MGRAIIQHPETKKWRVFSSITDTFITDWMTEEEYYKWRIKDFIMWELHEPKPSTWYTFEEAMEIDRRERALWDDNMKGKTVELEENNGK